MYRVYNLSRITNEIILAAGDAFKDDKNRQVFMTINDELAFMWVDQQVAQKNLLYKQFFLGLQNNGVMSVDVFYFLFYLFWSYLFIYVI